jgi:hypothetical protein
MSFRTCTNLFYPYMFILLIEDTMQYSVGRTNRSLGEQLIMTLLLTHLIHFHVHTHHVVAWLIILLDMR